MNYTIEQLELQFEIVNQKLTYLQIPSNLDGFTNTNTKTELATITRKSFTFEGDFAESDEHRRCPHCGAKMHINNSRNISFKHLPFGSSTTSISFDRLQYLCPICKATKMQDVSFKHPSHFITNELSIYINDLLASHKYTVKEIAVITGVNKNIVKSIDLTRLKGRYTIDGQKLKKPEETAKYLGIDEFKLHDGHKYATHIVNMETGHILWIAEGKKKQVVYDFIDHVGLKWMDKVEAIACDMNSDFQEAFEEKCEHIQPVFDHFHIVKNFNDKVVSEVRKDEQRRLFEEGKMEEAKAFKKTRFILMSSRATLQKKDQDAIFAKPIKKGSPLFKIPTITRNYGHEEKYNQLLKENQLLFTMDIVKEKLDLAYQSTDEIAMGEIIEEIIDICYATKNKHFKWFGKLLESHWCGIVAHASIRISTGKIEGLNNKIKTIRRQGYGYPDDEYFFLKLIDMSHQKIRSFH